MGEKKVETSDTEERGIWGDERISGWGRAVTLCRQRCENTLLAYRLASIAWAMKEFGKMSETQEAFLADSPPPCARTL